MKSKFEIYKDYIKGAFDLIDEDALNKVIKFLWIMYKSGDPIFIIGNGGSAANASHFAQDLVKGTFPTYHGLRDINNPKTFKAIALTDNTSFITATSNDDGYEHIFTNQLKSLASKDSLLIAISGSGNSPNIINALKWAKNNKIPTILFTGFNGGKAKKLSIYNIHICINDMLAVETMHSFIFHYIIEQLKLMKSKDE